MTNQCTYKVDTYCKLRVGDCISPDYQVCETRLNHLRKCTLKLREVTLGLVDCCGSCDESVIRRLDENMKEVREGGINN